jgi:hypothetical protein
MRAPLLVPVVVALAAAFSGPAAGSVRHVAGGLPCANTISKLQGKTAVGYCGPATVTLKVGGKTYSFTSGLCIKTETFTIQLGTDVEGATTGNGGLATFSINVMGSQATLSGYSKGKKIVPDLDYLGTAKGGGKNTGTFAAAGPNAPKLSGSWNCHGVIYKGTGG